MFRARRLPLVIFTAASLFAALALAPIAAAHQQVTVGPFDIEIGWLVEPTYVGQPNAVQFTIHDKAGKPVTDLGASDISVVVSTAGTNSPSLSFDPAFDLAKGDGTPGEYDAAIVPTAPGDYSFHITGSIHGTKLDISGTSSADTFNSVVGSSDIEFPAKVPTMDEVSTHLDRIDSRIAALQSASPGGDALTTAQSATAAAQAATDSANRALLIGALLGGAGVVIGAIALWLALRSRRKEAGPA
ncbi:MAG TPA: hypothetical protein VE011_04760 [Candidatus Dormibacteraeota bacterium]|nr:hypothetical protein [Candidatus Dormibacteraeota bacterium]